MTETCVVDTATFCLTFPKHFLILAQSPSTLALNDASNTAYRTLTVNDINAGFYAHAPSGFFSMELWSDTRQIKQVSRFEVPTFLTLGVTQVPGYDVTFTPTFTNNLEDPTNAAKFYFVKGAYLPYQITL